MAKHKPARKMHQNGIILAHWESPSHLAREIMANVCQCDKKHAQNTQRRKAMRSESPNICFGLLFLLHFCSRLTVAHLLADHSNSIALATIQQAHGSLCRKSATNFFSPATEEVQNKIPLKISIHACKICNILKSISIPYPNTLT